jgi:hypothetical protein
MTLKSKSFIKPSIWQDETMVIILAFTDASFGCYAADRRTDRIPEFNTSLIGRGKNTNINNLNKRINGKERNKKIVSSKEFSNICVHQLTVTNAMIIFCISNTIFLQTILFIRFT